VSQSALPWRYGTSYFRGQPVYRLEAAHDDDQRWRLSMRQVLCWVLSGQ
jgi:hypothetical protein